MKSYSLKPLSIQEMASHGGFTHMAVITADDLTQAANNTAQAIPLATIPEGAIISKVEVRLVTPFQDKSDAAFNSTTVIVGDPGSTNRYITSQELNLNGAEIVDPAFTNTAYGPYTADTVLNATIGSMAAKALNNIDKGELHIFVQILDTKPLSTAKQAALISTK